ncbi:hypothetical protein [Pontivivens insulae]|uniref:DUF4019 domain-containing protein n=1 Tax=Pontivivens insulae TaxID=1639689 RepID=A0A2R8AA45_9RHOB|nr:hypothetical protein [Pontivivens insulae]RED13014.1 hypothetical protein DFR53_2149 [Pontivivens insulae]SPF29106.1 hypothetical protein POI8812_01412 [Pontivivens insulae]
MKQVLTLIAALAAGPVTAQGIERSVVGTCDREQIPWDGALEALTSFWQAESTFDLPGVDAMLDDELRAALIETGGVQRLLRLTPVRPENRYPVRATWYCNVPNRLDGGVVFDWISTGTADVTATGYVAILEGDPNWAVLRFDSTIVAEDTEADE